MNSSLPVNQYLVVVLLQIGRAVGNANIQIFIRNSTAEDIEYVGLFETKFTRLVQFFFCCFLSFVN